MWCDDVRYTFDWLLSGETLSHSTQSLLVRLVLSVLFLPLVFMCQGVWFIQTCTFFFFPFGLCILIELNWIELNWIELIWFDSPKLASFYTVTALQLAQTPAPLLDVDLYADEEDTHCTLLLRMPTASSFHLVSDTMMAMSSPAGDAVMMIAIFVLHLSLSLSNFISLQSLRVRVRVCEYKLRRKIKKRERGMRNA